MSIALPKKRRDHHASPTASCIFTEQEALALLLVVRAHYHKDPERPWRIAAQTRAEKKINDCLVAIIAKKQRAVSKSRNDRC